MIADVHGKVISIADNEPRSGPSSHLFMDKMTGRLWNFSAVSLPPLMVSEDSHTKSYNPTSNYGNADRILVGSVSHPSWRPYVNLRGYLKTNPFSNAKLHFKVWDVDYWDGSRIVDIHEITDAWSESTITWNNQPSLGALLDTITMTSTGWYSVDIANAQSVCVKMQTEYSSSPGGDSFRGIIFRIRSSEYGVIDDKPYFESV